MKVIVTGSSGLIGRAVCEYLQAAGYEINPIDFPSNLCDEQEVKDLFSKVPWLRGNEALINCFALNDHIRHGYECQSRLMDISLESFSDYLKTNVTALFSVCREFARNNQHGSIVNFTSTYGLGSPNPSLYGDGEKHIAYGVSKAAVIQLTKHLAVHWAPNIRVNCIAPGGVENGQPNEFIEAYSKLTPMGRMAKVEEICGLVEFLISDKSSYCTGGVYPVDGGWTAW